LHDIDIRTAGIGDINTISSIFAKSWRHSYKNIISGSYLSILPDDHWVDFLTNAISEDSFRCVVADCGGAPVGAAVMRTGSINKLPGHGELSCLYVLPGHMGNGIGSALMSEVFAHMRKAGLDYCVLDVLCDNARAITFYKHRGFVPMDFITRIDLGGQEYACLMMRKRL